MRTRWIILPVMLLGMACSKQAIDAPAIMQWEQLQPEYSPCVDPNGRAEGSGIDPHGIKGDQGSGIDPNGKTDPPANTDAGSSMDPNGKPATGSFGIDPNGKDSGPRMDDNGKNKDSGPGMDPNGKPGSNGKGMGLDPNG